MEYPYWMWECYKNGMYKNKGLVSDAVLVLSDPEYFDTVLCEVINKWPITSENHLSNHSINRQAWCGQVACCYKFGVGEQVTRKSWKELSDMDRYKANKIADIHIKNYDRKNRRVQTFVGNKGVQKWDTGRSPIQVKSTKQSTFIQGYLFSHIE